MNLKIVTLKSFGDFVIACNAVMNLRLSCENFAIGIIAGEHVRSLAMALGFNDGIEYIGEYGSVEVPSAFDIRKRGLVAGLISIIKLRSSLSKVPNIEPIFDSIGWREILIGYGRTTHALPSDISNIYLAYDHFFKSQGCLTLNNNVQISRGYKRAIIIPGSRVSSKIIPSSAIDSYVYELKRFGIQVHIGVLDGELFDLPQGVDVLKIPRNFNALFSAIIMSDLVISADSLSGHVSEFYNIPVFVSTGKENTYWLPRSSYLSGGWAIFGNEGCFRGWLERGLNNISP